MPRIRLAQWRRASIQPSAADHAREDRFLDGYIDSGALIHQVSAETLSAALLAEEDVKRRELFALRIYADYVGALETMGAWGWAIRNRDEAPLLLDAFLSYEISDVIGFYRVVSEHDGELSSLLALPSTQTITDEFRRRGFPHAPLLADFNRLAHNLSQAATHYLHPSEIFVATYNKAKHGAPVLHDPSLPADQFLLLAPEREPDAPNRYASYKFHSSDDFSAQTLKLVRWVSHSTQAIVSFARNLKRAELLYS